MLVEPIVSDNLMDPAFIAGSSSVLDVVILTDSKNDTVLYITVAWSLVVRAKNMMNRLLAPRSSSVACGYAMSIEDAPRYA